MADRQTRALADMIEARADEIAAVECLDASQCWRFMSKSALRAAENFRFFADRAPSAADGARIAAGGAALPDRKGYFFQPTLVTGVDQSMLIARPEVFGPVLTVIPFEDEEDAIAKANDVDYGLTATYEPATSSARCACPMRWRVA